MYTAVIQDVQVYYKTFHVSTGLMCGKVAQWLIFWAVNHDTMDSNPATTVYGFIFLLTCLLTPPTLNTVFFPNVLL